MKYYNFETMFISLAEKIGDFLKENNIYFEISKNGKYYFLLSVDFQSIEKKL